MTTLQHHRYSSIPFPSYRFVPGQHPHPTAHPEGHSYQSPDSPHSAVKYVDAVDWEDSAEYLYGCDLYNHGYWWEAHEAWEELWQLTDKKATQGQFLQTLIQVAACHLKWHMKNEPGVKRLRQSSQDHAEQALIEVSSENYMGLGLASWLDAVSAYYDAFQVPSEHDPHTYPYITLATK